MLPAILVGGVVSYAFSRLLAGDDPPRQQVAGRPYGTPPQAGPPMRIDAHMEPQTRAGFDRLLLGGTPEQLDQAAMSLLRSGYPLAAQICVTKAGAMRQFDEQRKVAAVHRERMLAAQAQHAQALAAENARADALAAAATKMHALAADPSVGVSPHVAAPLIQNVQSSAGPATVGAKASPPEPFPGAPPSGPAPGEAPVSPATIKKPRKARALAVVPDAPQHVNGRAGSDH